MGFEPRATLLCAVLLAFLGCSSTTTNTYRSGRAGPKADRKVFILDRIEIDQEAVAAGAHLLFSEPAPQRDVGLDRAAAGTFSVSDRKLCSIRTRVTEPAVGLDGQIVRHRYDLLIFDGAVDSGGSNAVAHRGVGSSPSMPEGLIIETDSSDAYWVQPVFKGQKQAYRFHYTRKLMKPIPVAFPWK
ncbi:MAG: hypothetical protein V3W41_16955 [Planctomycetota bacterium]